MKHLFTPMRKVRVLLALISSVILTFQTQAAAETYFIVGSFSNNEELVGDSLETTLSQGRHTFAIRAGSDNTILGYSAMDHEASQKNYWDTGNYIQFDMCSAGKVKIKMANGKIVLTGDYAPQGATVCSVFGGTLLHVMGMDPNKDFADMTLQEDGTWVYEKKNLYLTAAKHEYFVVFDHQMMFQFPITGRPSFKIGKEGYYTLKFIYDPEAATLTHEVTEQSAADAEAALFLEGNLVALNAIVQGSKSHTFGKFHEATGTNFSDTVRVQKDKTVTIYPNTDYIIQSITVDGQALEVDANGLYTFVPQADSRIKVQATEVEDITVYLLFNAQTSSTISANISGLSSIVLEQGTNELTFKGNRELTIKMNSWGESCLVRKKDYADILTLSQSVSLSELNQGDTIYIETVTYSNITFEGTVDALVAIKHSKGGWQEITDPTLPISVINGIPVSLRFNTGTYSIQEIIVNEESTTYGDFSGFIPTADSNIKIVAYKYGEVNIKLTIEDINLISEAYVGEESLDLHTGENDICFKNWNPLVLYMYSIPCTVKKNGVVLDLFAYGYYPIYNLQEGDVLEVLTSLTIVHPTANENTAVVIVDDASLVQISYLVSFNWVNFDLENGTQYLNAGNYSVLANADRALNSVTLNHVPLEPVDDYYDFSLSHGDTLVIRATYDSEQSTLTFTGQTDMLNWIYQSEMVDTSLEGLTSIQVGTGYSTQVKCSTDAYVLDSVLVNGKKAPYIWLNTFTIYPKCDSEVRIYASPAKDITVTLRVSELIIGSDFMIELGCNFAQYLDVQSGDNRVALKSSYGISVSFSDWGHYVFIRNGEVTNDIFTSSWNFGNFNDGDIIEIMTYDEWLLSGIETLRTDIQPKTGKCLIDGKVVLLRNGRKYDLMGKEL